MTSRLCHLFFCQLQWKICLSPKVFCNVEINSASAAWKRQACVLFLFPPHHHCLKATHSSFCELSCFGLLLLAPEAVYNRSTAEDFILQYWGIQQQVPKPVQPLWIAAACLIPPALGVPDVLVCQDTGNGQVKSGFPWFHCLAYLGH